VDHRSYGGEAGGSGARDEHVRRAGVTKPDLVGTVSHELRSPLNVTLGYLELLLDQELGPLTREQAQAMRRMQQQSVTLLELITALIDLSRLEAGRLPVQLAPVSIAALLQEIREQLPESWRRPEVEIRVLVDPDLPAVETDPAKLRTVIRNLVHNALKSTERGHVTLAAHLTPAGDLTLTVSDTGRGMPPDAVGNVFDMFRQVPGGGGGAVRLSLHVVRQFVELLGGAVTVASELGTGSRFTVTLPRGAAPRPGPDDERARPAAPSQVRADAA